MLNPQDPKIIERYKALPQPLKDALWAEETIDHIFDVGKAQHLTVSQMGELADVVGLIILGILKPEDFGSEVRRKLNLTMERASAADAIVAAINEKIFAPLRSEILGAQTPLEATPLTGRAATPLPKRGAEKKDTPPSSQVSPPAPQPVSIFARHMPEPPRYQGQDPYREPIIDGEAPSALSTQPTDLLKTTAMPAPAAPLSASEDRLKRPTSEEFRGTRSRPLSWADISPEKEKATSHPDAKSALERAMNDGVAPEKTNAQKYQGKDPYREPL